MTYITNPVMQHGWMCPNCLTAHSPSVMTCPFSQTVRLTGTSTGTAPSIPTTAAGTPYPGVTIRAITTAEGDA
jgi:hypothetical protein